MQRERAAKTDAVFTKVSVHCIRPRACDFLQTKHEFRTVCHQCTLIGHQTEYNLLEFVAHCEQQSQLAAADAAAAECAGAAGLAASPLKRRQSSLLVASRLGCISCIFCTGPQKAHWKSAADLHDHWFHHPDHRFALSKRERVPSAAALRMSRTIAMAEADSLELSTETWEKEKNEEINDRDSFVEKSDGSSTDDEAASALVDDDELPSEASPRDYLAKWLELAKVSLRDERMNVPIANAGEGDDHETSATTADGTREQQQEAAIAPTQGDMRNDALAFPRGVVEKVASQQLKAAYAVRAMEARIVGREQALQQLEAAITTASDADRKQALQWLRRTLKRSRDSLKLTKTGVLVIADHCHHIPAKVNDGERRAYEKLDDVATWRTFIVTIPQYVEYLTKAHQAGVGGHQSANTMEEYLRGMISAPDLKDCCRMFVSCCTVCAATKTVTRPKTRTLPGVILLPERRMDHVQFDFCQYGVVGADGEKYSLLIVDVFSRYLWHFSLQSRSARELLHNFLSFVTQLGRMPTIWQSDNAAEFKLAVRALILMTRHESWNLPNATASLHKTSAPYNPQTNGLVEQTVHRLKSELKLAIVSSGSTYASIWEHIPRAVVALNTSKIAKFPRVHVENIDTQQADTPYEAHFLQRASDGTLVTGVEAPLEQWRARYNQHKLNVQQGM